MAKKLFYKIGEACKILEIQPYVLRYWETEFPFLKPSKSKSGQRTYSEQELNVIRRIKALLYEEGYTIAGAKKKLEAEMADPGHDSEDDVSPADGSGPGAAAAEVPSATAVAKVELDSVDAEKIKTLRAGVEGAITQAREILDLLSAP